MRRRNSALSNYVWNGYWICANPAAWAPSGGGKSSGSPTKRSPLRCASGEQVRRPIRVRLVHVALA